MSPTSPIVHFKYNDFWIELLKSGGNKNPAAAASGSRIDCSLNILRIQKYSACKTAEASYINQLSMQNGVE